MEKHKHLYKMDSDPHAAWKRINDIYKKTSHYLLI